jgi:CBS domain-containing protein
VVNRRGTTSGGGRGRGGVGTPVSGKGLYVAYALDHERIVGIVTETDLLARIVGTDACCSDVEAIVVSYP